ncbi:Crp/Fnr family transcriptional regulator [Luteolibacter sp. LG18]|uniref:Crp/Fnr family transcriptional regulator n=1 Tax=Luteolibacter sp. LG18 TaxID=2819286 RepID=UPI002B2C07A5|nr:transcriptional regulator [Luteolibacter sp. LG18]
MHDPELIRLAALASSLQRATIFSGLPETDLQRVAGYSRVVPLKKNEILFREGDPVEGFYVVTKGLIKAYRIGDGGREQLIHLIHAGESFAEPAVAGLPGYPAHTRALEKSEVVLIHGKSFLDHLRDQSDLALRMLASLSRHLHDLVSTIENYKLRDAETRLLHWLLRRCGGSATASIELGIRKGVLASELGTRQETLSRIFAKLRDEDLIEVKARSIEVPDVPRLRRMFEEHLQPEGA